MAGTPGPSPAVQQQAPPPLPDPQSPRESVSPPPPDGPLGDVEEEIRALHQALYELGCAVLDAHGPQKSAGGGPPKPLVPTKVNQVVAHLGRIEDIAEHINVLVPIQILDDVDNSRNPTTVTRDRIERAATENQFMHGKISAIEDYRSELLDALQEHFPEAAAAATTSQ
ncbi:hypothetical protein EXIGLDRAFT_779700 [Exidia glandulosa HHB12029]|uniref:Mediator of RNA polymerase II transcription subunit 10 n=1 Tax=Exidia glandulosa HHB12029 TaxID=1314781 RepID=A0A165BXY2_EXIGL|nr:hypothetical protein EXIGLDRAFT_779700 [Exidia glandulosa HHB12029]